jgi:hypothetical protein
MAATSSNPRVDAVLTALFAGTARQGLMRKSQQLTRDWLLRRMPARVVYYQPCVLRPLAADPLTPRVAMGADQFAEPAIATACGRTPLRARSLGRHDLRPNPIRAGPTRQLIRQAVAYLWRGFAPVS